MLKIRGLCRNKQAQPTTASSSSSLNESSSLHYSSAVATETVCDKTLYDQHNERMGNNNNNAIIKESPVIVTSPQHMGTASASHKPSSTSSLSTSSSAATSGSGLCPPDHQDIPMAKKVSKSISSKCFQLFSQNDEKLYFLHDFKENLLSYKSPPKFTFSP